MAFDGGPTGSAVAVTPSDTTTLGARALYVGTAGNLTVDLANGGTNIVFKNVASGTILPVAALKVKAATTAADIVALY